MRSDRVKAYNAIIVPPTMLLIALALVIAFGANWLRGKPNLDKIAISISISVAIIVSLSPVMRAVATRGLTHATGAVGTLYVATLSINLCVVAHYNGNGVVQAMPLCAILAVGSVFFWPREWHFALGLICIMSPPLYLLFAFHNSTDIRYIFSQLALITIITCTAFYFLIRYTNLRLFALAIEVEYRASHDALTGLFNRAEWFDLAEKALDDAHRDRIPCSLLFVDIDEFKGLNDRQGHAAGDVMLKRIAVILSTTGRDGELIGRFGGDEFVLLLPGFGAEGARERANRIESAFNGTADRLTASIGIAEWNPGEDLDLLVHRADEAMFVVKAQSRATV
ncbi:MAG: GGDEF domain-containing protein [Thermomicrobiales bacterium]